MSRASGPRQRTRNPRQRPIGEFLDGEGVFAEGPLSGTRQSLCRGPGQPSAKKRSRHAPAPLAVSLPRADPRQRNGFFLNFFCRGPALGKEIFLKPLTRASSLALGKEIFRIFPKKNFAEGYCKGPRQRFFFKKKHCLLRAGPRQRNSFL